jgi:hypothetical protein
MIKSVLGMCLLASIAGPAMATNYIVNGDFEAGNTGFETGFVEAGVPPGPNYVSGPAGSQTQANTYTIATSGADAANARTGWVATGDHSTGHGQEMVVYSTKFFQPIFVEQVNLDPNKLYDFSISIEVLGPRPTLFTWYPTLTIDEGPSTSIQTIGGGDLSRWVTYTGTLTGGPTFAMVVISPPGVQGSGFAIDDISLTDHVIPAPEPSAWALMTAGFGIVGGVVRRRRPAALRPG